MILAAAVGEEGTTIWPPSVLLALADADKGFSSVSTPMVFQPPFSAFVPRYKNYLQDLEHSKLFLKSPGTHCFVKKQTLYT